MNLFIVYNRLISNFLMSPPCIIFVTELVFKAYKHCNWNSSISNLIEMNRRWTCLTILLLVLSTIFVIIELELLRLKDLAEVNQSLNACSIRNMPKVHLKSIRVIQINICIVYEAHAKPAKERSHSTN